MNLEGLTAFLAVAETGSFTGAAERLFLTQPAVSKRIALLEGDLGTRLFDRIGREVQLTEAGEALLPRARAILLTLEDTRRALHNLHAGEIEGTLTFGTSHHIGLHRLPPVLREYSTRYPKVQLDIHFIDSEAAWDDIVGGRMELGIVTLPPKNIAAKGDSTTPLRTEKIWDDPLAVVAANDHPLASLRSVTLRALSQHPAILPSDVTFTRRIVDAAFAAKGLSTPTAISTNYLETIKMMVAVGLGWSVLPASMIDAQVIALPVNELRIQRELGVVYHPGRTLSNAARAMVDMLHAERDVRD
ncbi:MAG: LysR family transcriptional regulator [Pseudomonadota bacterium]